MKIGRFILVIIGIMGLMIVFGNRGLRDNYFLRQRLAAIQQTNATLVKENKELVNEVALLKTDLTCIERIARDELGMVRKGDIVYRVSP